MTNKVAFVTEFFPFTTKISGEVINVRLFSPPLFKTKGLPVATLLNKNSNKDMTKLL